MVNAGGRYKQLIDASGPTYFGGGTAHGTTKNLSAARKHQNSRHYAEILANPFQQLNAQIPDTATYPTAVYSQVEEFNIAANVGSCAGVRVQLFGAPTYELESGASTDSAIVYNTGVAFQGNAQVQSQFARHRLVAAGCYVEFCGNDAQNQGIIVTQNGVRSESNPTTFTGLSNVRDGYSGPLKYGAYLRYRPLDSVDLNLVATNSVASSWGSFIIHTSSMAAVGIIMRVRVYLHWEGIYINDNGPSSNISHYSPSDSTMYEAIQNHVSELPSTGSLSEGVQAIEKVGKNMMKMIDAETIADIISIGRATYSGGLTGGAMAAAKVAVKRAGEALMSPRQKKVRSVKLTKKSRKLISLIIG